jgi:hypothetical protein
VDETDVRLRRLEGTKIEKGKGKKKICIIGYENNDNVPAFCTI